MQGIIYTKYRFYNELSAKCSLWTCQGIDSVFFRYSGNYFVTVSTCLYHK